MGQVNVTISGKTYRMACDDGQEEHLESLGRQLGDTIELLRSQFGEIGDQRLTVMAAITLADRYSESEQRIGVLEAEIADLAAASGKVEARETGLAETLDSIAERLATLTDRLNGSDPLESH